MFLSTESIQNIFSLLTYLSPFLFTNDCHRRHKNNSETINITRIIIIHYRIPYKSRILILIFFEMWNFLPIFPNKWSISVQSNHNLVTSNKHTIFSRQTLYPFVINTMTVQVCNIYVCMFVLFLKMIIRKRPRQNKTDCQPHTYQCSRYIL